MSRIPLLEGGCGAEIYSSAISCNSLRVPYGSSMVRYIILRRNLKEIPPHIFFRPARLSAWLFAKRGFLHSIQPPDPATWCSPSVESSSRTEPLLFTPNDSGLLSDILSLDADSEMESWSDDEPTPHLDSAPRPKQDNPHYSTRHANAGLPRLSDTCPYTCVILNQNVNGLGFQEDKLEQIIETM